MLSTYCTQNNWIGTPTPFKKAIAGLGLALTITAIALNVIGLAALSSGPFNVITNLGATTNGVLLEVSIFICILDLIWIATLYKKKKPSSDLKPRPCPFKELPHEICWKIFDYLSAKDLAACFFVSKEMMELASSDALWNKFDLKQLFPNITIFDESDWATLVNLPSYGLDVSDISPLNKCKAFLVLSKRLSLLTIEGNAGVTLLTIPKGLTLAKLAELAKSHNIVLIGFKSICCYENIPVKRTYRIGITNHLLERSRDLDFDDQKRFVNKIGCEIPKALEITTLLVITFMRFKKHLYSNNSTSCSDQRSLRIGYFSPSINWSSAQNFIFCDRLNYKSEEHGTAGVWRGVKCKILTDGAIIN